VRLASLERGGAYCRNSDTAGQTNGNIDPDSLCPLWMAPGQRLRTDASKAFNVMSKYHAKVLGQPLCVTDSYRSYARQVDVYHRKPGLAAVPGTSQHGWGLAVDLGCGVQDFGSPAYNWMKANAGRFGFFHPDWAEPSGSTPEAWHWEFRPSSA
jgi:LAS superfamily LD-carboxypeptidase LdcB